MRGGIEKWGWHKTQGDRLHGNSPGVEAGKKATLRSYCLIRLELTGSEKMPAYFLVHKCLVLWCFDKVVQSVMNSIKHKSDVFNPRWEFFVFSPGLATNLECVFIKIYAWEHNYFFKDIIFCGLFSDWGLGLRVLSVKSGPNVSSEVCSRAIFPVPETLISFLSLSLLELISVLRWSYVLKRPICL